MVQLFSAYKCNNNNSDPELVSINQWYNTKSGVYACTSNLSGNFGPFHIGKWVAYLLRLYCAGDRPAASDRQYR